MKKTIIAVIAGIMIAGNSYGVYACEKIELGDMDYYYIINYEDELDDFFYNIYDANGNVVKENLYSDVKYADGGIIVSMASNNLYGVLDRNLNQVIEPNYYDIKFNNNTKTYECVYSVGETYNIDFYNNSFEKISRPRDIAAIEGTNFFCERIIDEENAINSYYFLCDKDGNRLVEEGFAEVRAEQGNIIVTRASGRKQGIYDKNLKLYNDIVYDYIYYDEKTKLFKLVTFVYDDLGSYLTNDIEYLYNNLNNGKLIKKLLESSYYIVKEDEVYYICDENGNHISENPYYDVVSLGQGFLEVRSSNKYGILNDKLEPVTDEIYFVIYFKDDVIYCHDNGKTYTYDPVTAKITENPPNDDYDFDYLKPIKGMEGKYIYYGYPYFPFGESRMIIDDDGNRLSKTYSIISTKTPNGAEIPEGTFIVRKRVGIKDSREGVLNSNFEEIVPVEYNYVDLYLWKGDDIVYFIVYDESQYYYYDIFGNKYNEFEFDLLEEENSKNDEY